MKCISEIFGMLFDFNQQNSQKRKEYSEKEQSSLLKKSIDWKLRGFAYTLCGVQDQLINHRDRTQYKKRYHRGNYLNPEYRKKTGRHTGTIIYGINLQKRIIIPGVS